MTNVRHLRLAAAAEPVETDTSDTYCRTLGDLLASLAYQLEHGDPDYIRDRLADLGALLRDEPLPDYPILRAEPLASVIAEIDAKPASDA